MGKTILILGGGIGGTAAANVLSKLLKKSPDHIGRSGRIPSF